MHASRRHESNLFQLINSYQEDHMQSTIFLCKACWTARSRSPTKSSHVVIQNVLKPQVPFRRRLASGGFQWKPHYMAGFF